MTPPYFCNYFSFEEGLALYLYKLEFPICKDEIETGQLVLEKILKLFSNINT
jgi:hypothetical protein